MAKITLTKGFCKCVHSFNLPKDRFTSSGSRIVSAKRSQNKKEKGCLNKGWTYPVLRRLEFQLHALDWPLLKADYEIFWCTFTFRDCPSSYEDCSFVRYNFLNGIGAQCRRLNIGFKFLWVLEFQERGVPHYHMLLMFDKSDIQQCAKTACCNDVLKLSDLASRGGQGLLDRWLLASSEYRTLQNGQVVFEIVAGPKFDSQSQRLLDDASGYLISHTTRSNIHKQRAYSAIPVSWGGATGAVWGQSRGLPTDVIELDLIEPIMKDLYAFSLRYKIDLALDRYVKEWQRGLTENVELIEKLDFSRNRFEDALSRYHARNDRDDKNNKFGFNIKIDRDLVLQFLAAKIDKWSDDDFLPLTEYVTYGHGSEVNIRDLMGVPF